MICPQSEFRPYLLCFQPKMGPKTIFWVKKVAQKFFSLKNMLNFGHFYFRQKNFLALFLWVHLLKLNSRNALTLEAQFGLIWHRPALDLTYVKIWVNSSWKTLKDWKFHVWSWFSGFSKLGTFAVFRGVTPPVRPWVGVGGANSCTFLMWGGSLTILSRKKIGSKFFGYIRADLVRNPL